MVAFLCPGAAQFPLIIAPSSTSRGPIIVERIPFTLRPYTYVSCINPWHCTMSTYTTLGRCGYFCPISKMLSCSNTSFSSGSSPRVVLAIYAAVLRPAMRTVASWVCLSRPSTGYISGTSMFIFEKLLNSAPGPDISMMPSWNATIFPEVATAQSSSTFVSPFPTVSTSPTNPGNTCPEPLCLKRG